MVKWFYRVPIAVGCSLLVLSAVLGSAFARAGSGELAVAPGDDSLGVAVLAMMYGPAVFASAAARVLSLLVGVAILTLRSIPGRDCRAESRTRPAGGGRLYLHRGSLSPAACCQAAKARSRLGASESSRRELSRSGMSCERLIIPRVPAMIPDKAADRGSDGMSAPSVSRQHRFCRRRASLLTHPGGGAGCHWATAPASGVATT